MKQVHCWRCGFSFEGVAELGAAEETLEDEAVTQR